MGFFDVDNNPLHNFLRSKGLPWVYDANGKAYSLQLKAIYDSEGKLHIIKFKHVFSPNGEPHTINSSFDKLDETAQKDLLSEYALSQTNNSTSINEGIVQVIGNNPTDEYSE